VNVTIYIEGSTHTKGTTLREGFRKLLEQAGLRNRMPKTVACGGRDQAFDKFKNALLYPEKNTVYLLLVDSEDPVSATPWQHLKTRDNWQTPPDATDDQVHFMATCMETWLIADRRNLQQFFGSRFHENALPATDQPEQRNRKALFAALENATRDCRTPYKKGQISFELLATTNPKHLQGLGYFRRFVETLERLLPIGGSR
jgi:Domain of unknown function (DUF4276)